MIRGDDPFIPDMREGKRGLFSILRGSRGNWKVLSGRWEIGRDANGGIVFREPLSKGGESMIVFGPSDWDAYSMRIRFRLLTESIRPPEGGVIVYFHFRDVENFYSFHFCLPKQRVEFVKRYGGVWTIGEGEQHDFRIQRDYRVNIRTGSGLHICRVDGRDILTVEDTDISGGCAGIGAKYCGAELGDISVRP